MKNRRNWVEMLTMVLVFGMLVIGCDNGTTGGSESNAILNGTWVNDGHDDEITFNNGDFEKKIHGFLNTKGTYTITGNNITMKVTHYHSSGFNDDFGINLTSQWYTQSQFRTALGNALNGIGWSTEDINDFFEGYDESFLPQTGTYTLSGNELAISLYCEECEEYHITHYLKKGSPWTPPSNSTTMIANQWISGNLTNSNSVDWYSFSVISGQSYYIWSNDICCGDGTQTGEVNVVARYNDGTIIFNESCFWDNPEVFTSNRSGLVYIRVTPDWGIGTYKMVFSTVSIKPTQMNINIFGNLNMQEIVPLKKWGIADFTSHNKR